jgi:probable 2-oxoglutarate dehydrogenase E1 component DHKTD1
MIRNFRKPLVVVAPKILLRLPAASSSIEEMLPGTTFQPVISDSVQKNSKDVKKLIFVSGKHYFALAKYAEEKDINNVAFIRLEQLCPFPTKELQDEVARYPNAKSKKIILEI